MALTASFYADAVGVGRVRAGKTVADSQVNALPGGTSTKSSDRTFSTFRKS